MPSLKQSLDKIGISPSDEEIQSCANEMNEFFQDVFNNVKEDLEDVIAHQCSDFDETQLKIFNQVYSYIKQHPKLYRTNDFTAMSDHLKQSLNYHYPERDGRTIEETELEDHVPDTFVNKIQEVYDQLHMVWENYEADLLREIEKRQMIHFKNDKQFHVELDEKLKVIRNQFGEYNRLLNPNKWKNQKKLEETIAMHFIERVNETIGRYPQLKTKMDNDKELNILLKKLQKIQELKGYVDPRLNRGDTRNQLNAIATTEQDLDSKETIDVLGTHRTNKWLRRAYNLISVLFAGIAAAFRAGASYHKYGTIRFYLPKGAKTRIQAKDLIKKANKLNK